MSKSLQMSPTILNCIWPDRIRSKQKRSNSEVGGTEGVGTAAEEEDADRHVCGHVRAVGFFVVAAVDGAQAAEDGEVACAGGDDGAGEEEGILTVAETGAGEGLVVGYGYENQDLFLFILIGEGTYREHRKVP